MCPCMCLCMFIFMSTFMQSFVIRCPEDRHQVGHVMLMSARHAQNTRCAPTVWPPAGVCGVGARQGP